MAELLLTIAGFDPKLVAAFLPELENGKRLAGLSLLGLFGKAATLEGATRGQHAVTILRTGPSGWG